MKICVVASCMFGMISGSAVADVVAIGIVSIPLMRNAGYPGYKAAGVQAVASTGGTGFGGGTAGATVFGGNNFASARSRKSSGFGLAMGEVDFSGTGLAAGGAVEARVGAATGFVPAAASLTIGAGGGGTAAVGTEAGAGFGGAAEDAGLPGRAAGTGSAAAADSSDDGAVASGGGKKASRSMIGGLS